MSLLCPRTVFEWWFILHYFISNTIDNTHLQNKVLYNYTYIICSNTTHDGVSNWPGVLQGWCGFAGEWPGQLGRGSRSGGTTGYQNRGQRGEGGVWGVPGITKDNVGHKGDILHIILCIHNLSTATCICTSTHQHTHHTHNLNCYLSQLST